MSPENFVYWLQGFFELKKTIDCREGVTPETLKVIEDHLALVLEKKTPNNKRELVDGDVDLVNEDDPIEFVYKPKIFDWNPKCCTTIPDATGISVDIKDDGEMVMSPQQNCKDSKLFTRFC